MSAEPLLRCGDRLVFLGDSITADPEGYVSVCAAVLSRAYPRAGIEVLNAGRPGETAAAMACRFERDVLAHRPSWVAISAGANDAALAAAGGALDEGLDATEAAIARMCAAAESAGVRVALCTPTAFEDHWQGPAGEANAFCAALTERLTELAAARGYVLVPMFEMCRRFHEAGGAVLPSPASPQGRATLRLRSGLAESASCCDRRHRLTTDGVHMAPQGRCLMTFTMLAALHVGAGVLDREGSG